MKATVCTILLAYGATTLAAPQHETPRAGQRLAARSGQGYDQRFAQYIAGAKELKGPIAAAAGAGYAAAESATSFQKGDTGTGVMKGLAAGGLAASATIGGAEAYVSRKNEGGGSARAGERAHIDSEAQRMTHPKRIKSRRDNAASPATCNTVTSASDAADGNVKCTSPEWTQAGIELHMSYLYNPDLTEADIAAQKDFMSNEEASTALIQTIFDNFKVDNATHTVSGACFTLKTPPNTANSSLAWFADGVAYFAKSSGPFSTFPSECIANGESLNSSTTSSTTSTSAPAVDVRQGSGASSGRGA